MDWRWSNSRNFCYKHRRHSLKNHWWIIQIDSSSSQKHTRQKQILCSLLLWSRLGLRDKAFGYLGKRIGKDDDGSDKAIQALGRSGSHLSDRLLWRLLTKKNVKSTSKLSKTNVIYIDCLYISLISCEENSHSISDSHRHSAHQKNLQNRFHLADSQDNWFRKAKADQLQYRDSKHDGL